MSTNGTKPNLIERARAAIGGNGIVSEIIGRYTTGAQISIFKSRGRIRSIDQTVPDYEFYDKLRRGKAKGYSLGGLFTVRIERIFASWVLGRGVEIQLAESGDPDNEDDPRNYTDGRLADFLNDNHALLMQLYRDCLGLGDQYIIVNADGSLSVPSPDTVEVERDEMDYRQVTAVKITTKLDKATVTDTYMPMVRTVETKYANGAIETETYINLIGRIPVIHLANGRSANETNGHPIHEPLLPLYDQYDDTIYKQLDGAKLLGNPIPTFEGMEDINQVITENDPGTAETYTDKDGNTATRTQLTFDQNTVVLVGKGGRFHFAAPPTGFSADTRSALKSLFLLLMDHTGIPEFIWGNEMSSARASSDTQLTQWVRDIEGRQRDNENWLLELCDIWLLTAALIDPRIVLDMLKAVWPQLIAEDEEIQLKRIQLAKLENLLTDKTTLALLNLVDDPGKEAAEAREESDRRREEMFPDGSSFGFQQRLNQDEEEEEDDDE